MQYVDMMGFLAPQGEPPIADPNLSHLDLVHLTCAPPVGPTAKDAQLTLIEAKRFIDVVLRQDRFFAATRNDLTRPGKTGVIFGLQHAPDDIRLLDMLPAYKEAGISVMAIAYDGPVCWGCGWRHPNGQLTFVGRELIERLDDLGIIVDLSHASHQTAWDIVLLRPRNAGKLSTPRLVSHGGEYGRGNLFHPRNLPADVHRMVALWGGLICTYALTFGHSRSCDKVHHFTNALLGAMVYRDACAIGTDSVYQTRDVSAWEAHGTHLANLLDPDGSMGARWPDYPLVLNRPDKMAVIERELVGETNSGILGANALRWLARNLTD